jgi:hypothetical protein
LIEQYSGAYKLVALPGEFHAGDEFRLRADLSVTAWVHVVRGAWPGLTGTIPAGERLRVAFDVPAGAQGVSWLPERYSDFEWMLVSAEDRALPGYGEYALTTYVHIFRDVAERLTSKARTL